MKITQAALTGSAFAAAAARFSDGLGAFACFYDAPEAAPFFIGWRFEQIDHLRTSTVDRMHAVHFQYPPHAKMKPVRCFRRRVFITD